MKDIIATVMVDLTPALDEIVRGLQKDARWGLNRAMKEGLIVKTERGVPSSSFYGMYRDYMDSIGITPLTLDELESDLVHFTCYKDEEAIAVASLKLQRDMPTLNVNASLEGYRHLQPNNLLYWNCITWAKEQGYKELDLGGWQINARDNAIGVNKFKEKWGTVTYYYEDFPVFKAIGRKLIRNFGFFWWLNKKIRGRK